MAEILTNSITRSGKEEGGVIECGGEREGNKGYFIKPTVISNVKPDMKVMKEEIFGPVAAIAKFSVRYPPNHLRPLC